MKELQGTGVAMITPFTETGEVDYHSYTALINTYIQEGIDYLVVLGTTAETATLSLSEKQAISRKVVEIAEGRIPLVLGMGGNNTQALVDEFQSINLEGYTAVLSVCPYYNRPNQTGIYQHFKAVAQASPLPMILYNVPSRTGASIANTTTLSLAKDFSNIIGIKDASGDMALGQELIDHSPADFLVLSGDDATASELTLRGGQGVISVIAGGLPKAFSSLIKLALGHNPTEVKQQLNSLLPMIDLLFEEGNPTGLKSLMAQKGWCKNVLRLPLVSASKGLEEKIAHHYSELEA